MKSSMSKKYIIKNAIDLANPMLGTKIINCSDEFFAPATRIINPLPAIFKENAFENGNTIISPKVTIIILTTIKTINVLYIKNK